MLRDYQQRAIDQCYDWMRKNSGHPCLVLPTGSGKSHIIAAICKDALTQWPETRILMLTHVKELIEQNASKMLGLWQDAPMGIYSAGLGRRELGQPITFAGIQSVRNKADQIGHTDLVIIDESHLVSHKNEGGYRRLISQLQAINPDIRIIGLSATPYRLGHGYITDGDALFDALIEPVTIEELIAKGHLSTLKSKHTAEQYDMSGVHKRGGEYIEKEMQAAVNNEESNKSVVAEAIERAGDKKAQLYFCAGVDHALNVRDELIRRGIKAATITGKTPKNERNDIIKEFKAGRIQALTNAMVLTTGFDYPDIDLVVLLRPTLSPGLYVQMVGRGMRIKSHTDHCVVLDFAGVVAQHGPITNITPPSKAGTTGEAPVKVCPGCDELLHPSIKVCPECGFEFPPPEEKTKYLRNDDIMGVEPLVREVTHWDWCKHISRVSGKAMLKVGYYGCLSDRPIYEYFPILHSGYAEQRAWQALTSICVGAGMVGDKLASNDLDEISSHLNDLEPPKVIKYKKEGRYYNVIGRIWHEKDT